MKPFELPEINVIEQVEEEVVATYAYDLFVFNDDVNTFEHVTDTLIEVCEHEPNQAEQCTLIIHYKGKASVKNGTFEQLAPMRQEICRRGISAEVYQR